MATMKAIRMHAFGGVDVLHYEEIERPDPAAGEVLVQVRAAGVNPVDWGARSYPMPSTTGAVGARQPYILGWDLAGEAVALGAGVTQFDLGEAVFGMPRFPGEATSRPRLSRCPR
jgi:NADPH:quinone reductase-like Zn-dependent oxidoreductase